LAAREDRVLPVPLLSRLLGDASVGTELQVLRFAIPNKTGPPSVMLTKRKDMWEEITVVQPAIQSGSSAAQDRLARAFDDGRRAGLATAAMALSLVAFFSLLGAEKALLAIALGLLARRGSQPGSAGRRLAGIAIGIASVFLVSIAFVLVVFWNELVGLVNYLRQLS